MRGNAPLSTGKYDETFEALSSGNFDPRAEMQKLELLNLNLAKQREVNEQNQSAAQRGQPAQGAQGAQ